MANKVFANNMEIACKAASGKVIAAFPDVCFTPPDKVPATPIGVPVPYPNTGSASDTTKGSKKVLISSKEIILKNKSYFKKSMGDEAGCAQKKGVITSKTQGKVYFQAWSMDVKIEGKNAARHMDIATNNHASMPGDAPPQLYSALQAMSAIEDCQESVEKVERECDPWEEKAKCPEETEAEITKATRARTAAKRKYNNKHESYIVQNEKVRELYRKYSKEIRENPCRRALKCVPMPYNRIRKVQCKKQTGEHLIETASVKGKGKYKKGSALTISTEGPSYHIGTHGLHHMGRTNKYQLWKDENPGKNYTVADQAKIASKNHSEINPNANCNSSCIEKMLVDNHAKMDVKASDEIDGPSLKSKHSKDFSKIHKQNSEDLKKMIGG